MPWIYNTFIGDESYDVEYIRYPEDESVGSPAEYEIFVYDEIGKDVTMDLSDEQRKEIEKECKEHHAKHRFQYND